jgi:serine/threonine protein kinase
LVNLRPRSLEPHVAVGFALDIARAMECLHAHGIIHRDLKPENLLLTADQRTVKLVDLGLAREETLTEMMTAETGTYRWMAPEVSICQFSRSFVFCIIIDVSWNVSTVVQHSYVEAWRKEALQPQSRCLQLCNCAVGTPPQ